MAGPNAQDVQAHRIFETSSTTTEPISTTHRIEWTDFRGMLDIVKHDADNSNIKLSGVTIRVEGTGNNNYDRIFITDNNGRIHIENLKVGTYKITEISNPHYGYQVMESDNVKVVKGTQREYSLANAKYTGNLTIQKKDTSNNTVLSGVTFKIANQDGKYLIAVDSNNQEQKTVTGKIYLSNFKVTNDDNQATEFITDNNGKIEIVNLLTGNYQVKEISVGDHYGYEVDDEYISWEANGTKLGKGRLATVTVTRQKSYQTRPDKDPSIIEDKLKTIKDGIYEIETGINSNKTISLHNSDPYNGVTIQSSQKNNSIGQRFFVKYLGNGDYHIISIASNKYVTLNGSNIQAYVASNENTQKWKIQSAENGYYKIVSKQNGQCLEVVNNQLQAKNTKNSNSQKFKFKEWATTLSANEDILTVKNERKYIKLSGYVWENLPWEEGKEQETNELYNDGQFGGNEKDVNDKLLEGIKVELKDMNGNIIDSKITGKKGNYQFVDVLINQLPNYYIEFQYNGMCYQNVEAITNKPNGNKATEGKNRTDFNNAYKVISQGKSNQYNLTYKEEDYKSEISYRADKDESKYNYGYIENAKSKFPVNGVDEQYIIRANIRNAYQGNLDKIKSPEEIRKNGIEEVKDINLGIQKRGQPDLTLVKDIHSTKVTINNAEHLYKYADRFNENLYGENGTEGESGYNMTPQVRFASKYGSMSYTRALYPSDVYYKDTENNNDNELRVRVTYQIGIKNKTDLTTVINEIDDYYDDKYEIDKEKITIGKEVDNTGEIVENSKIAFDIQKQSGYDLYYKIKIKNINMQLGNTEESSIYVQLEVKQNKIQEIVEKNQKEEEEVKLDNIAEIASYSVKDKNGNSYAGIDENSQPGNLNLNDTKTYEDDTDKAPGLKLVLQEERKTDGIVYIDQPLETNGFNKTDLNSGKIRQGDGTYNQDKEKGIAGVTVQLINMKTGEVADIYDEAKKEWKKAQTETKEDGSFSFEGFIPEQYQISYIWGGQTYLDEAGEEQKIRVQDYKGTIYKDKERQKNLEWYKMLEPRYSDAMDSYDIRQEIDKQSTNIINSNKQTIYHYEGEIELENGTKENIITQMASNTPTFRVNIEYGTEPTDGKQKHVNYLKNIDFGIIERAKQALSLEKKIKEAKVILPTGNVLVDAKITKEGQLEDIIKFAVYIPKSQAANGQLKIEVDNEILQSSRLEIEYHFKVNNISELDYQNKDYYLYGEGYGQNNAQLVKLDARTIIDYLDNNTSNNATEEKDGWHTYTNKEKIDLIETNGLLAKELKETVNATNTIMHTENLSADLQPIGKTRSRNKHKNIQNVAKCFTRRRHKHRK